MTTLKDKRFEPDAKAHGVYNELYAIYRQLHDSFGNVVGRSGSRSGHEAIAGDPSGGGGVSTLRERRLPRQSRSRRRAASWSKRSATSRSSIARPASWRSSRAASRTRELTPDKMVLVSLVTGDRRRGHAAPVVRYADAPRAVSRVHLRRHRAHPFGVRDDVRAGADADWLHGDDARGLLPRRHPGDAADDRGGDRRKATRRTPAW